MSWDLLVAAFFGAWLLATVAYALPSCKPILNRWPALTLFLPLWNFFAPNPGVYDYFLLVRNHYAGGFVGPWKEVSGFASRRPWFAFLWNPHKIDNKILFDLVNELVAEAGAFAKAQTVARIQLSLPYLFFLHYVTHLPRPAFYVATQFLIMRRAATADTLELLFVSSVHQLETEKS